jgi:LacI family transcriptional regulator
MRKTIYDIAKELNVAPSTVSKALNGRSGISEAMRKKITDYANEVRFYADANASKLKTKKSYSIGVVYSEDLNIGLEHNFFSSILQSFKSYVESKGYEITFVINNLGNRKMSYLDFCYQKNIDGVFIVTSVPGDKDLEELVTSEISCVTTDIYYDNLFTVISDNVNGAKQAVDYFYQTGHTQIGHVTESYDTLAAQERFVGFKEKMVELGLPVNEDYIFSSESYSYDDGYEVGKKFLELDHYPTAMFVVSDIVAMGFIKALKDGGLKVPEDVSVIGFDDLPFAKQFEPSLSTIRQDARVLGEKAAHKLLELMENKTENRTGIEKIPVELMVRDSVKSSKQ